MQHPQREGNHLQILAACGRANVPRPCTHIKNNRPLQPWHQKVRALVDHGFLDSGEPVKDDGAGSTLDVVDGGLHDRGADGGGDDPAEQGGGYCGHGCVWGGDEAMDWRV